MTFGACVVDLRTRELKTKGTATALPPKMFCLLTVLLEHRPRALSKTELHERIWADTFVSDGTLSGLVADLRRTIGDDGGAGHLIRTLYGFGYAFSGEASVVSAAPPSDVGPVHYLMCRDGEIALTPGRYAVGRARESAVWIDDPAVSRRHAQITVARDVVTLQDLGSKNGTHLNGRRLQAVEVLTDGNRIVVGPAHMRYRVVSGDGSTLTRRGRPM